MRSNCSTTPSQHHVFQNALQEGSVEGTNGTKTKEGGHVSTDRDTSAGAGVAAATVAGAALTSVVVGRSILGGAGNATLDIVALVALELVARRLDVLGRCDLGGTTDIVESREAKVLEGSAESDGTTNVLELAEATDITKASVVGNDEATTNLGQSGEGEVLELGVADNGQSALLERGQVREGERSEVVGAKAERAVDSRERGGAEGGDVRDGHVGSPLEVGQGHLHLETVGINDDLVADGLNVGVEGDNLLVVVQVQERKVVDIDSVEVLDSSVGNKNAGGLSDTRRTEGGTSEESEGHPFNLVDTGQTLEVEAAQADEILEAEGAANRLEEVGSQRGDVAIVLSSQVTADLLKSTKIDGTRVVLADKDAAVDVTALGNGRGISGRADGGSRITAANSEGARDEAQGCGGGDLLGEHLGGSFLLCYCIDSGLLLNVAGSSGRSGSGSGSGRQTTTTRWQTDGIKARKVDGGSPDTVEYGQTNESEGRRRGTGRMAAARN